MKEYFDVLSEDGTPLGEIKSRQQVHKNGDWHQTVHIWILCSKKELLLQKRSLSRETFPGLWDISCAGHVSAGEDIYQGALRELAEELGLLVTADCLEDLFKIRHQSVLHNGAYKDNEWSHVLLLALAEQPVLTINKAEVEAVQYLDWRVFQQRLKTDNASFVPHKEEYAKLFEFLNKI